MPLSVRLDSKTESVVNRLAKSRRQTKSEVIRDAIGVLAEREQEAPARKRPYDLVKHLIGCAKGGPRDLSTRAGDRFYEMLVADRKKRK
jgi:Arc/MetJ-type ribon-helix-helix transcriptional regulator